MFQNNKEIDDFLNKSFMQIVINATHLSDQSYGVLQIDTNTYCKSYTLVNYPR